MIATARSSTPTGTAAMEVLPSGKANDAGRIVNVAQSASTAAFLARRTLPIDLGSPCETGLAGGGEWSSALSNRRARGAQPRQFPTLTVPVDDVNSGSSTGTGGALALKLSADPGDDGVTDQETEAAVDALNEAIDGGPDDGETPEEWLDRIEAAHEVLYGPGPEPCETFDPPSTGDCPLVGNLAQCSPPCVFETSSGCDIDTLPFEAADGLYDMVYSVAQPGEAIEWEMIEMVQYAWAVLLENLDLVEWIACLFYGETTRDTNFWESLGDLFGVAGSVAECLADKIEGRAPDVTIQFVEGIPKGGFATSPNALTGGTIKIPVTGSAWNDYVTKYKTATPGSAEEFCIIGDLAATLLHELVHSCSTAGTDDAPGGSDNPNVCSTSYLIENSFRWALGKRYPCLCSTTNCSYYVDDRTWRSDDLAYPGTAPF